MHEKEIPVTERYLVPAHGPDKKKLGVALVASIEAAKKHNCEITVLVPTLRNAENTILEDVLGEKFVKNLVKGKRGQIEGVYINLKSLRTINPHQENGIILSLWGGKKALSKTNKAHDVKSVIALPWIPEDVEQWVEEWTPKVIETGNP